MPGIPDILRALQSGGQPQGNLGNPGLQLPILAGLGAQQQQLQQIPPELLQALGRLLAGHPAPSQGLSGANVPAAPGGPLR